MPSRSLDLQSKHSKLTVYNFMMKTETLLTEFGKKNFQFPVMIRSLSVQSLFEVHVHFPSVSNPFYICFVFAISLHMAVYDFDSLLKRAHAGQQFACSKKNDSDSLNALIPTVLATVLALASHASLNHTLGCFVFILFFRLCHSTVHQGMALVLQT